MVFSHRTNTGPGIGQTAARVSDGSRYRRMEGRTIVCLIREDVRLQGEFRKEEQYEIQYERPGGRDIS